MPPGLRLPFGVGRAAAATRPPPPGPRRAVHTSDVRLAHFKKPRQWPVKPPRPRLPAIVPGELGSSRLNADSVLDRDVSEYRASRVEFELSPDVQLAVSIETEALRDHLWEEFRLRHGAFSEELDAELQRELQDAYETVRARWVRVQAALDGTDEALRAQAQAQLRQCIEGRSHFNPDLAQKLRDLERWLPAEAADYLQELKQTGRQAEVTEEDLAVLQRGPAGEPPATSATTAAPNSTKPNAAKQVTVEEALRLLQAEYTAMVQAGQLPAAAPEPMSEADLAHHRRVLRWEMEQDPHVVEMLEAASGLSKDQLLDEVLAQLGPPKPPS